MAVREEECEREELEAFGVEERAMDVRFYRTERIETRANVKV